jgi:hypothetical protein
MERSAVKFVLPALDPCPLGRKKRPVPLVAWSGGSLGHIPRPPKYEDLFGRTIRNSELKARNVGRCL